MRISTVGLYRDLCDKGGSISN